MPQTAAYLCACGVADVTPGTWLGPFPAAAGGGQPNDQPLAVRHRDGLWYVPVCSFCHWTNGLRSQFRVGDLLEEPTGFWRTQLSAALNKGGQAVGYALQQSGYERGSTGPLPLPPQWGEKGGSRTIRVARGRSPRRQQAAPQPSTASSTRPADFNRVGRSGWTTGPVE